MKRVTALIGVTALTAVVGVGTAGPTLAAETSAPSSVTTSTVPLAAGDDGETAGPKFDLSNPEEVRRYNFEQRSVDVPQQEFEQLITQAILENDPNASQQEIERILDALSDIGKIIAAVEPGDMARVGEGIAEVSAAIAAFTATGNPEAARQIVCGSGDTASASLDILSDVLRVYEKSENLPQVAEVLNLLDPRTPEGRELFDSLPEEARTPEVRAALISLSEIGRALHKVDEQEVIALAKAWADVAAKCDVEGLLEVPRLMVRTFELAKKLLGALDEANLGDLGMVLAPAEAAAVERLQPKAAGAQDTESSQRRGQSTDESDSREMVRPRALHLDPDREPLLPSRIGG